jgi:hypothetical protein
VHYLVKSSSVADGWSRSDSLHSFECDHPLVTNDGF